MKDCANFVNSLQEYANRKQRFYRSPYCCSLIVILMLLRVDVAHSQEICTEILPDIICEEITDCECFGWYPKLHVKTNTIALGLGMVNAAAELELRKHWSFSWPIYYSAWDYFKSTIKFRTFAIQPELRFWLSEDNDGFYAGAHFGLAYYNFAFNGAYRYQDHNRETPAVGGGLSIGYRLPICRNYRYRVEFSLGTGVYSNYYDKFHNTPKTKNGLMIKSIKKAYWGIDQVAVSFSYMFDFMNKGGQR